MQILILIIKSRFHVCYVIYVNIKKYHDKTHTSRLHLQFRSPRINYVFIIQSRFYDRPFSVLL